MAVERHDDIVRREIEANRGYVFKTVGDAFCAAFDRAGDAVAVAIAVQRGLSKEDFSSVGGLLVRIGLHCGDAVERSGDRPLRGLISAPHFAPQSCYSGLSQFSMVIPSGVM
jgi:class 3 adenylate cyclase